MVGLGCPCPPALGAFWFDRRQSLSIRLAGTSAFAGAETYGIISNAEISLLPRPSHTFDNLST
jgi:hypothetical protein